MSTDTIEKFHCHDCGAQAGIAGDYSDDPDERDAEIYADEQFREDWDREHANCKPVPPREPTEYEVAIFKGLQAKPMYLGYGSDIIHLPRPPHGPGQVGRVEGYQQPDPRIAEVERRRAKNRVARKSRRVNRIASNR